VLFSGYPRRGSRTLTASDGKITFGILADTISGVGTIAMDQMVASRAGEVENSRGYIKGITGKDLFVLDAAAILADPGIIVDDA
jgi:purine-binding chemotaxis protein CheW